MPNFCCLNHLGELYVFLLCRHSEVVQTEQQSVKKDWLYLERKAVEPKQNLWCISKHQTLTPK